jgi:23S rRNA (uracil1939-C5)-methyltransferase
MLLEAYCGPVSRLPIAEKIADALIRLMPEVMGVAVFEQPSSRHAVKARLLAQRGRPSLVYEINAAHYQVSAGSFFQVNRFMLGELVAIVTGNISGQLALDLYAGVGLFSTFLARSFSRVVAVEASPAGSSDLARNAGGDFKVVRASTEEYLRRKRDAVPDLVVVDPPRSGLGEQVVQSLIQLRAPRIRYVSCDPSTLARDLRWLLGNGYRISELHLLDLFPQTYHIETIVEIARKAPDISS